jgi:hypothetical protein
MAHFAPPVNWEFLEPTPLRFAPNNSTNQTVRHELMSFSSTDSSKSSIEDCLELSWNYHQSMTALGLQAPFYDHETDSFIGNFFNLS